jgi:hypothetical protein
MEKRHEFTADQAKWTVPKGAFRGGIDPKDDALRVDQDHRFPDTAGQTRPEASVHGPGCGQMFPWFDDEQSLRESAEVILPSLCCLGQPISWMGAKSA